MPYNWPALIIALLVLFYWGRVLYMVFQTRRHGGRANLVPPEPLGRLLRIVWIPTVTLWIGIPMATAFVPHPEHHWPLALRLWTMPWLAWAGVVIALAAYVATRLCWRRMGSAWRMGIDPHERPPLIVTGAFAYVRHPIYALSSLLMLCSMVAVCSPTMIGVGLVHILLLQWEARREERYLLASHGQEYREYMARTRRFWPGRRRVKSGS